MSFLLQTAAGEWTSGATAHRAESSARHGTSLFVDGRWTATRRGDRRGPAGSERVVVQVGRPSLRCGWERAGRLDAAVVAPPAAVAAAVEHREHAAEALEHCLRRVALLPRLVGSTCGSAAGLLDRPWSRCAGNSGRPRRHARRRPRRSVIRSARAPRRSGGPSGFRWWRP